MIEYRVKPVTRYIVTRWEGEKPPQNSMLSEESGQLTYFNREINGHMRRMPSKSTQHGEFENADQAYAVAYALCKTEHDTLGYPPADDRIQYPELPKGVTGEGMRF